MNGLKKAVAEADEAFLTSLANKGLYKRACKDIDGAVPEITYNGDTAEVITGGEKVTLKAPLTECKCSCVSRTVCRHIIGAVLLMKSTLTEEDFCDAAAESQAEEIPDAISGKNPSPAAVPRSESAEEEESKPLTEKQKTKIRQCALQTISVMSEILKRGLVRVPASLAENLEISAVRCHSLKMADAERAVREVAGRLSDCIERRSSFDIHAFTKKYAETLKMLYSLAEDDITPESLGVFRQKYETYSGLLEILPIGQRTLSGGEYEGEIYYFLNLDENAPDRFLSLSDIRASYYEKSKFARRSKIVPWNLSSPLSTMMKTKMTLGNAKLNGGKISTSQETQLLMQTPGNIDCDEVRNLVVDDFAEIIAELSIRNPESETDRMFFVHPKKCISSEFDKYTQNYILTIEDFSGRQISVKARYRDDTKEFIRLLEIIGEKMVNKPKKQYVILACAYIENGNLTLFPIEIYDFIRTNPHVEYELPEEFADTGINAFNAEILLSLLDEIRGKTELAVQCGLQTGIENDISLENRAFNYGLKGLSLLLADFSNSAEVYRHGNNESLNDIMQTMSALSDYISAAEKKLELISALG